MTQPDPRDAEAAEAIVGSVIGLIRAVHHNDNPAVVGQLALLIAAVIAHRDACAERVSDAPLRRAVARLNAGGQHSPPVAE